MRPLVYSNVIYSIIFGIALAIWYVPELIGATSQRAGRGADVQDRGSYILLLVSLFVELGLSVSLPALAPFATITATPWVYVVFWLGIVCMLLGVALRWYAIRTLGRFFTWDVAVRGDQTVVQTGPYRYIRHPAYSGTLLTTLGIGLALTNWLSLVAIVGCTLIGHLYRVRVEEAALRKTLGQPYADYMRRTKRFIPFVF